MDIRIEEKKILVICSHNPLNLDSNMGKLTSKLRKYIYIYIAALNKDYIYKRNEMNEKKRI